MAKFLTTAGTAYFIEQLTINASSNLILVTPYLQLSKNIIDRLKDADQRGIHLTLIYGKDKLKAKQRNTLNSLDNISIFFCQNLHAKCYCNEKDLIISSMNLYEFSEKNNREMSIKVSKDTDNEIFADAMQEIESIKNASLLEKKSEDHNKRDAEAISIDPDYNELWNFHMPYLYKELKKKFPDYDFQLSNKIISNNFPKSGMRLEVDGRVDLKYEKRLKNYVTQNIKNTLEKKSSATEIYFNHRVVNLYPTGGYEVCEKDMKERSAELLDIIKHLQEVILDN